MALTITSKTHAEDDTARSTYTTGSVTVPTDSLAILVVNGYDSIDDGAITPTLSSSAFSGITHLGSDHQFDNVTGFGYWVSLYWARGTGVAATMSIPWGVTFERCRWIILQVSPDPGGTVSLIQGKVAVNFGVQTQPISVTLSSALTAGSAIVSGEGDTRLGVGLTPGTGYTELFDTDETNVRQHAQYRLDPASTTVTTTPGANCNFWIGAVEVLEFPAGPLGFLPVGF